MKVTFLGSGGGRVVTMTQVRATGGFLVEVEGRKLYFDPGPGALVRARQYGVKISDVDAVFVSHAHLDHYNDACAIIEAMTRGGNVKRGVLVASKAVVEMGVIQGYHFNMLEEFKAVKEGDVEDVCGLKVTATKTVHTESGVGFVVEGKERLGYTSDGEYYEGMERNFLNCDVLIVNVMRPWGKKLPLHMSADEAKKLISLSNPKIAILTHFSMLAIRYGPEKLAKEIEGKTGVKTIAARDGMVVNTGEIRENTLKKWIK